MQITGLYSKLTESETLGGGTQEILFLRFPPGVSGDA